MTKTLQSVLDSLNELGNADEIAEFFKKNGVTGLPGKSDRCPVAYWVRDQLNDEAIPTGKYVYTVAAYSIVGVEVAYSDRTDEYADTPVNVGTFMRLFDERLYPDLIGRGAQ